MIGSLNSSYNGECVALTGHYSKCSNKAKFALEYEICTLNEKIPRKHCDEFCEEHAYEFFMYFSNYLGLRIKVIDLHKIERVEFT